MVGLPGAFRQLYRKYSTLQQQWSSVYRKLFMWAWRRKRFAMQRNDSSRTGWLNIILARLVPQIDTFLGGNLRYIIVCDRDMPSDVKDFLEVTLTVRVLSAFGFPEAGGLVSMQSPSITSPQPEGEDCGVVSNLVGFPLPCNELKLVPVWLGAHPPSKGSVSGCQTKHLLPDGDPTPDHTTHPTTWHTINDNHAGIPDEFINYVGLRPSRTFSEAELDAPLPNLSAQVQRGRWRPRGCCTRAETNWGAVFARSQLV